MSDAVDECEIEIVETVSASWHQQQQQQKQLYDRGILTIGCCGL